MYYLLILFSLLIFPLQIIPSGRLIEVCGIDGAGKTTFVQDLNNALTAKGRKVVVLKPLSGDRTFYKFLNELDSLKTNTENADLHKRIDRFKSDYFSLCLLNHRALIDRYISEGYDILCDRYIFSFKTYQECFKQSIQEDEVILSHLPKVDVTFLITAPVEIAMSRIEARGVPAPYENPVFLGNAQEVFLREAGYYPHLMQLDGEEARESNIKYALFALEEI